MIAVRRRCKRKHTHEALILVRVLKCTLRIMLSEAIAELCVDCRHHAAGECAKVRCEGDGNFGVPVGVAKPLLNLRLVPVRGQTILLCALASFAEQGGLSGRATGAAGTADCVDDDSAISVDNATLKQGSERELGAGGVAPRVGDEAS
jgi:hypothetical protein